MGSMMERLQLVVEATTSGAEARFDRLTSAAQTTGEVSTRTANDVAAAADRVLAAQAKQADAAKQVEVAQLRYQELQSKGNASASQLAAAEGRVESAQRRLHTATREVTAAQEEANTANDEAAAPAEKATRGAEGLKDQLGELKGAVVGIVAGASLADWAQESVSGFLEGARGAYSLSKAMNATVAEGGQLVQLFSSLGLETNDLLEIQAEFAGTTKDGLTALGTQLKTNKDGTVDWAATITDTLGELQKIPDATERNRQGFAMFGEEGYKQLSALVNSSTDVKDALEQIGVPFTDEDVAAAQEYDSAMLRLELTSGSMGRTLGRALVPMLTESVELFGKVADVVTAIPAPIGLAAAAAIVLGVTGFNPLAFAAEKAGLAITAARVQLLTYSEAAVAAGASSTLATAGMTAMGVAGGVAQKALSLVGGPLGVALIAAGSAYYFASQGANDLAEHAKAAAAELKRSEDPASGMNTTLRQQAELMKQNAGGWESFEATLHGSMANSVEHLNGFQSGLVAIATMMNVDFGTRLSDWMTGEDSSITGYEMAIEKARKELGEFGAQQEATQLTGQSLNDMIAKGTTSGSAFAQAVRDAANAADAEARTSDTAAAALEAYHAATDGAAQATLDLIDARYSVEDANFAFLQAMDDAKTATDDSKTSVDEARQSQVQLMEAAMAAAGQSADSAVAAAKAAGTIVTSSDEARVRAEAMLTDLRGKLNTPGLSKGAHDELQGLIDQLQTAQDKGDVQALVTLTGVDQAQGQLAGVTDDKTATVEVQSRGGPAVDTYLDGLAAQQRLAIVRVESRGGPAVGDYLARVAGAERLSIIRVESRGGPDVDNYLGRLAGKDRLAIIRVESRGGPDVDRYLDSLANQNRVARIGAAGPVGSHASPYGAPAVYGAPAAGALRAAAVQVGTVTLDLELTGRADRTQLSRAERGRAHVEDIRAYERQNGTGWRAGR